MPALPARRLMCWALEVVAIPSPSLWRHGHHGRLVAQLSSSLSLYNVGRTLKFEFGAEVRGRHSLWSLSNVAAILFTRLAPSPDPRDRLVRKST